MSDYKIVVYVEGGMVYEYGVRSAESGREHAHEIVKNGYRHNDGQGDFVHWPPHRIVKVEIVGGVVPTKYPDKASGT